MASMAVGTSRIAGLVRESVMGSLFGAGAAYDAFVVGFRIPNLTRDLFAEGALSSAFVPTFVDYLQNRSKEEAARLANLVASAILILVGGFCLLGILVSPWLVGLVTGDWAQTDPGKYHMAVWLTQIMFPFLLLVALAAQAMGILNACNQYAVPAMSSTMFNIASIVSGLILGFVVGPRAGFSPIEGMAYGVVIGGAVQLIWQAPSLRRSGFRFRFMVDFSDPGLRHIFSMMGPAILGSAAVQINVLVNTYFAAGIDDAVRGGNGPVSWLGYAFRFMQLPLGLFGVAIATATLPAIGRSASSGDIAEFRDTLARSLGLVFLLTVPSSIGLAIMGEQIVGAIYERARFEAYDTRQTAIALACYAVGLAGYSAVKVLTPAFYALKDSRTPMLISLCSIAINLGMAIALVRGAGMGIAGLALSTSAVALFSFFAQFWLMRRRIGGVYGRRLRSTILKVTAASLAMGGVVWASSNLIKGLAGASTTARLLDIAVSIPLGLAVLYYVLRLLKVDELELATRALAGPILRRWERVSGKLSG
jgi:putative peptidoglycan lipid II flippase